MKTRIACSISLLYALTIIASSGQAPSLINYQGRLLSGTNLYNGEAAVVFRLFDAPAGGTEYFAGSNRVAVVDGLYSTLIGSNVLSGSITNALTNSQVYLQVEIDGAVLAPREPVVSAAYALQAADVPGSVFWRVDGNEGLTGANRFLGPLDNDRFEIRVNSQSALRLAADPDSPIWAAGHSNNTAGWSSPGAVVAGGGNGGAPNAIAENASYSAIGGGSGNRAGDGAIFTDHAVISGGFSNNALATAATIGGGFGNTARGVQATVGGGENNQAYGSYATVAGGRRNIASNNYAAVGGGVDNRAGGRAAWVGGGQLDRTLADESVIAGGYFNRINTGGMRSTIAGGVSNLIEGGNSAIAGGLQNRIVGWNSLIAGGAFNVVSNNYSVVLGGYANQAAADNTLAAGWMARAAHYGSFVWADPDPVIGYFSTTSTNQFLVRARGGVGINTNGPFTDALTVGGSVRASGAVRADSFAGDGSGLTALDGAGLVDASVTGAKIQDGTITAAKVETNAFWNATGNAGTLEGLHFLGTLDNTPLTLCVNSAQALRLEPASVPNLIGGDPNNSVVGGVVGAAIGGGGEGSDLNNWVTDNHGFIGGGRGNRAGDNSGTGSNAAFATVGGGQENIAAGLSSFVGGGLNNQATGAYSAVVGGTNNSALGEGSFIGGGKQSIVSGQYAVVAGGFGNVAGPAANYAFVGGGFSNYISQYNSVIAGGRNNELLSSYAAIGGGDENKSWTLANYSVIAGGQRNRLTNSAHGSFIGAGYDGIVSGRWAVISGGRLNNAGEDYASVGGGVSNRAVGDYSTVPGGEENTALGTNSFAAGKRAKALHNGTFVWADSHDADFSSTTSRQFAVRASNGVWIAQNAGGMRKSGFGERFRDNGIVAWARITSTGTLSEKYNVTGCVWSAMGSYRVYIGADAASVSSLIPMAVAEVDVRPIGAANVRIVSVNQTLEYNQFDVWINDGLFAAVNNDFLFMVTGR